MADVTADPLMQAALTGVTRVLASVGRVLPTRIDDWSLASLLQRSVKAGG